MQNLTSWGAGFPGLLWTIEIPRSRLYTLNSWHLPECDLGRLLKDASYRKRCVRHEDFPLLAEFWHMRAARQPAAIIFRLNTEKPLPLLLQGWPSPNNPELYCGFLTTAFLPTPFVSGGLSGICQMDLGGAGYPVFALDTSTRTILTANAASRELFALSDNVSAHTLADITPDATQAERVVEAAMKALETDVWAGTLIFGNPHGSLFSTRVRVTPCGPGGGGDAVRVALLHIPQGEPQQESAASADAVEPQWSSLREGLQTLYDAYADELDGLMFSDIISLEGRVEVYGVGPVFAGLPWGSAHAYEGTIAQDIERFGLDSLIVDETLDSIKSIDWILFIPQGIRSYIAKPFFSSAGLHAVCILASRHPATFGVDAEQRFVTLMQAFSECVRQWRMAKRAS